MSVITLAHGGGGVESLELIESLFFHHFGNALLQAEDAACFTLEGQSAFTTDAFTVNPLFFPGGDIGKLSIAGTVNDLAMMGAKPLYISASFIIEEGLSLENLTRIVQSMARELEVSGAKIVCGDTKIVPKGAADGLFITTSGIGKVMRKNLSARSLPVGDVLILSGPIGRHGASLLLARNALESSLTSDCHSLWSAVHALIEGNLSISALRDATRGGVSAVLNEWARASNVCIEIEKASIPQDDAVAGVCEIFGFDPMELANEGTFVIAVAPMHATFALEILKKFPFTKDAAVIGRITDKQPGKVILYTPQGSSRYIQWPQGELLPRIC